MYVFLTHGHENIRVIEHMFENITLYVSLTHGHVYIRFIEHMFENINHVCVSHTRTREHKGYRTYVRKHHPVCVSHTRTREHNVLK